MSDLPITTAILSETVLKPCQTCGHPRGSHRNDQNCTVAGCNCIHFQE